MDKNSHRLTRTRHPMPDYMHQALIDNHLMSAYEHRPAYQRNDYIGWITRARRPETRQKRLHQMLDELKEGGVYMKMKHTPSAKK